METDAKTRDGAILGTPEYMSPEQYKQAGAVDLRTDIWSIGAILYRALTGRHAFRGPNAGSDAAHGLIGRPHADSKTCPRYAARTRGDHQALPRKETGVSLRFSGGVV